jgi:hypothetical protein
VAGFGTCGGRVSQQMLNPAVPADQSVPVLLIPPNHWRTRIRAISKWTRKKLLAIIAIAVAIAILATSAYFVFEPKDISPKRFDLQSRNDRPAIAIIKADVEGFGRERINLSLQLKNVETKTAYSLAIAAFGFDPKTEMVRQLTHVASTEPIKYGTSFTRSAFIQRSEMLPVVVLCLFYANDDKQGFSEHLYYDAPDASKISGRIELKRLAPEPTKRANDLNICRM